MRVTTPVRMMSVVVDRDLLRVLDYIRRVFALFTHVLHSWSGVSALGGVT